MRATYATGDVKGARRLALAITADESAGADARADALHLLEQTDVDPRALAIGAFALVLAAVFIGFFLF
ncbi:hypothetical protein [Vulgatibacter incomptus]|uniref:Uncharacterized protein n=1 Tax=Vulgatibacter incomptus TaxID=1391653 RepID=A0A0K1PEA7_9BACT|nr:hypothetical protein [Vulgatibacter incomptus]AKU91464.1 hypothetical protein AKJ08_1851 [Vulgatibacter incomptus]